MSRLVFDEPAWWQRTGWRITGGALAVTVLAIGWAATTTVDHAPAVRRAPDAPLAAMLRLPAAPEAVAAPAPLPTAASAVVASPAAVSPALSTQVAPGVHITPLGVPPGTEPTPAGPRPDDSEPEN